MAAVTSISPLLTPDEAAAWLRSKARTLERWRHEGRGPAFVCVGRHVAYRLKDLEIWAERQTFRHTTTDNNPRASFSSDTQLEQV